MSRERLESYLLEVWYGDRGGAWLIPLGAIYSVAMRLRRFAYRAGILRTQPSPVPVIVVGNVTVGGTGKTPLVIWLVQKLRAAGLTVAVVSRGYGGRRNDNETLAVDADADPTTAGDEPVLIARRTGARVYVDSDRARAVRAAAADGAAIVVSDDGLQHLRMARRAQIAVVDGERRFGNGRCLPAGPLREPSDRLADVDALLVNGGKRDDEFNFSLRAGKAVRLADGAERPLGDFAGRAVNAAAAIGHPERFAATLAAHGIDVAARHWRADHARLSAADLRFDGERPVLITEKDAVKLSPDCGEDIWYVPIDFEPEPKTADRMDEILSALRASKEA